jgi:hypothetical protein
MTMRKQYYFRKSPSGYLAWDVERLIALTTGFPVLDVPLSEIAEIDEPFQLEGIDEVLTCREIAEHVRLTLAADLRFPIILSASGRVMDGMHRVMNALSGGMETIKAVKFAADPEPDFVDVLPSDLAY